ncbi:MAG: helix-hairpin-helix domain-containing protein [Candidatus Latescibacterota bacterium]|nr:helix-hairpin-helix domain-containing protein [Candidatus Latescibacterota bacterium]
MNAASAEELEKLTFIGEKMAMRIVEHRRVNCPLQMVRQLQQVGRYAIKSCAILTG